MLNDLLNIVNDNDEIVGEATRAEIHAKGLLHREIHVWFYTEAGEIIFQHRAKDKDAFPDLLDATVGGHVEISETYETTAIKETREETGVDISSGDLQFLKKIKMRSEDPATGAINYAFKKEYCYLFNGSMEDLKIEEGKALGFELWPLDIFLNLSDTEKKKFPTVLFREEFLDVFVLLKNILTKN